MVLLFLALAPVMAWPVIAPAMAKDVSCDLATQRAASATDVPLRLLQAIAQAESGRGKAAAAWPWTVNSSGEGHWFPDAGSAKAFATAEIAAGRTAIDIGCFQMNLRWHGRRFASLDDMFDPDRNAMEAASFLSELHAGTGDWTAAAAAYHSRDPARQQVYLRRLAAVLQIETSPSLPEPVEDIPLALPNRFPLLRAGSGASGASLVPRIENSARLIGAIR